MQLGVVNDGRVRREDCRLDWRPTRINEAPMQRNLNHISEVQLDFVVPQRIEESVERLLYLSFEVFNNRYDFVNALLTHQTGWSVDEQMNVFVKLYVRQKLDLVHSMISVYTTALRFAASQNHSALSFGVRFWVLKSTYTSPKRVPKPSVHSRLSIALQ